MRLKKLVYNDLFKVEIKGDMNDGDYVVETTALTPQQFEDIKPILEKLAKVGLKEHHNTYSNFNRQSAEWCTEEEFDMLRDIVTIPYGEFGVCHTIAEMVITFLSKDGFSYEVIFEEEPVTKEDFSGILKDLAEDVGYDYINDRLFYLAKKKNISHEKALDQFFDFLKNL